MVRVVRGPAIPEVLDLVGLVVAVGVLQEQNPRLAHDEHAAVPELEARGAVELVVERGALVGFAVAVGVFEDEQLVVGRRVAGLPLRVVRHARDPEPALVVEVHLHGFGQFREHRLVREQLDLHAGCHGATLDELVRRQVAEVVCFGVLLPRLAEPRGRNVKVAGPGVVRLVGDLFALGDVPDVAISDRGHRPQLGVLAREGLGVVGAAAAVDVPAVDHAVVLLMHEGLVDDRGEKFIHSAGSEGCRHVEGVLCARIFAAEHQEVENHSKNEVAVAI